MFVVNKKYHTVTIILILCVIRTNSQKSDLKSDVKNATVLKVEHNSSLNVTKHENNVKLGNITNTNTTREELKPQHQGRENVIDNPQTNITITTAPNSTQSEIKANKTEPVHKSVVPKKGVSFDLPPSTPKANKTTTTTTTTAKIPHKPKITQIFYDEIPEDPKKVQTSKTVTYHDDPYSIRESHSADYVIPIIAVILSVPLVAIVISMLYKRGADWWSHRNYRRMDFLIEGMYNN
ncbi:unnamed protein product [Brassicogethes aeneus]|uniref:Uncharacterized protein n=1 Tax=Brassicogethes aeneus TaxID=1431903 RepID=A0A9P0FMP1_BRAAE|nr:unnamed protein product [Brassicogethes aeneus]